MSELRRNNLLWEGSRMMLPAHREQLQADRQESEQVQLPELAEDRLAELNWQLQQALQEEIPVVVEYVAKQQRIVFCGFITQVNIAAGWLQMANGRELRKIILGSVFGITEC